MSSMVQVLGLVSMVCATANAATTTPVYSLKAASPKNNAGQTLEKYIMANLATCLISKDGSTFAKDVTTTTYIAADSKVGVMLAATPPTFGTSWKGVYTPAGQACITDTKQTQPKTTCDPTATGTWPTGGPTVCAYTDQLNANCAPLNPSCYKKWQSATTTTSSTKTTKTTTKATTKTTATTAKTVAGQTTTVKGATTVKAAAAATPQIIIQIGGGPSSSNLGPVPTGCTDTTQPGTYCSWWATQGQCTSNAAYMSRYCKKSCNTCSSSGLGAPPRGCADTTTAGTYCSWWATQGQCQSNMAYMAQYCKRSCGVCTSTNASCLDSASYPLCGWWAMKGECPKNAAFMNVQCKASCKQC